MVVLRPGAALLLLLASACLTSPRELDDPRVQGDYEDGDEEHRPGQPCLLCHSDDTDYLQEAPGEDVFELAGTVYPYRSSAEDEGLEDVRVVISDASGFGFTALTNSAGNFMVELDTGVSEPTQERRGVMVIPQPLEFPLTAYIWRDADIQEMDTLIQRDGSCGECHGSAPGADSVGRVYLLGETP